ncbi:uncharacterized protein LOC111000143 isoform X2 [Pieris rapae]|uniref:uncharacterized protein LOC111000143 isoform X2 n=1 Tax=Pieris rapae TaxID=64459 RepID=UPI001E27D9AF|nr:uncharacterized protein LOC111000143 isoform X2 [Pieris rapae]
METLLDKFKREQGGLRRSRSVRASLRLIGNRWRSKDEAPADLEKDQLLFTKQLLAEKDYSVAYTGVDGTYRSKTPAMTRRKLDPPANMRKKSGDVDLVLKPQRPKKVEKKFSDLFYKKQKSVSAKELLVPEKIPPKAAAILHIHSPDKGKKKKANNRPEIELIAPEARRRQRRGSESDTCVLSRGCVNQAFVYSTPPKDRKLPLSPSAYLKLHYGALVEGCAGELPSLSACAPPARPRARDIDTHTDNRTQIDIHQQALFAAVEHGYLDKARNILDSTDVDVNSINTDGLSPLDVAVLTGNRPLATMLMEFGAKDGGQFKTPETLGAHLRKLCREAESRLREVGGTREPLPPTTTGCAGTASERDKQLQHWDRRHRTLKRLTSGWSSVRTAGSLPPPGVEVCGPHAVCVRVPALRDARHANSPILTKYKVEWSSRSDFSNVCGTREVSACTLSGTGAGRVLISGLTRGRRYYFRVAAGNLRGWSDPTVSLPRSVVPSSWRDVSSPVSRGETGKTDEQLDAVATACANARRTPGGAGTAALTAGGVAAARARKNTIRQLFTGSKFHKNLRRGVYLACVVYQEERVLVTSEEFIPVVEVDETGPAALGSELHWLMKVSCAWPDVKSLRTDLQKHPSPSLHFRRRLLAAVAHMQAALSLMDLGQVYPTPLRDAAGTLVISLVSAARAGKPPALNSRWVALHKLRRRGLGDDNTIADLLLGSLHDQIRYHQVSRAALPRGLYVGYLKLQASVDEVRVVVSANAPNVPPHTRLRDNPHVSAEEWQYLKSQSGRTDDNKSVSNMSVSSEQPSECQEMFLQQVSAGAKRLFRDMELPADSTKDHRFYDLEVVELSGDVSFVMLCPPPGRACCVPGQREMLLQRAGLLSLPVQAFEMIHLQTYRPHLLAKFCRLSCLLELDVALAAHSHREAFSCDELNTAKERLTKLEDLQNDLNTVWKTERWLMDLIGFARDKSGPAGVLLEHILDKSSTTDGEKDVNLKIDLLQIPARDGKINKTSPGRGSWPGPGGSGPTTLHPEFSKSEQQLSVAPRQPSASTLNLSSNYLNESQFKRKGSGDSQMTQSSNYMSGGSQFDIKSSGSSLNGRLPPSRSEDTLVLHNDAKPQPRPHSISASLPSASPLLSRGLGATSMVSVRGNESAQSLSSDSDCHSCPKLRVTASESMASLNAEDTKKLPETKEDNQENEEENREQSEGGILQVFAAYETGLAAGTSLKLHVTARTTAREVIELVVKQLNMAALLRARRGPLYPPHRLPDFCLVAVIGARERCLRDDFRPLQLQNPWRRGRLYVRLKHDVLAALTHSANQPAYI